MKMCDVDISKVSPMMRHYISVKKEYPDVIIFYRLGDFYEIFFEDAVNVSRELELTLTGRNAGLEERVPMCGVPHHSKDIYVEKLIDKGYKVGICDQLEDAKDAKGIVERGITQIISKGTIISSESLSENKFDDNTKIKNLIISDSVEVIPDYAFSNNEIETLILGNNVKSIGESSFKENKIIEIIIPDSVTHIKSSFDGNNIKRIVIGKGITSIYISWLNLDPINVSISSIEEIIIKNSQDNITFIQPITTYSWISKCKDDPIGANCLKFEP